MEPYERSARVVSCKLGITRVTASYQVDGRNLVLSSRLGNARVPLGLVDPHRLAVKVLRNLCAREARREEVIRQVGDNKQTQGLRLPMSVVRCRSLAGDAS